MSDEINRGRLWRLVRGATLAFCLLTGLVGCSSGPDDRGFKSSDQVMRDAMNRCGLTTADLYMVDFMSFTTTTKMGEFNKVPCDQVPQWLADYRTENGPQLDFMVKNPQESQRPQSWSDLRYLVLVAAAASDGTAPLSSRVQVLVDFDHGVVYSSNRRLYSLDTTQMDAVPLRQDNAQQLIDLLASTTTSWPYPAVSGGGVLPAGMTLTSWSIGVVTRDESLYRFDQTTGASTAPDGFVDIYDTFWALAQP